MSGDQPNREFPRRGAFPPLAALLAFDAVARLGGVRRAADGMGIDHSAISRHLRVLEAWTGVKLMARTGRSVTLTAEGRAYHARVAGGLDAIASATLDLVALRDDRRLSIRCVPGFAFQWLSPRLPQFQARYPDVDVELRPPEDATDLGRDAVDADIRYFATDPPAPPRNIRMLPLCDSLTFPVASPQYLAERGAPASVEDVLDHPLIHEGSDESWRAWLTENGMAAARRLSGPRLWQGHLTMDAARRGQGIALGSQVLAGDDIAGGRLVELTGRPPHFVRPRFGQYVLFGSQDRWRSRPVSRFRNWLKEVLAADMAS